MERERNRQSHILFLSDDLEDSQVRLAALGTWNIGGNVETSLDAAAARCADGLYDLLIVDVHTHAFDGIAACRRLRDLSVNPLLLVAYASDERDKVAAYQAGIDDFLARPIGLSLFVSKIRAWLRHSWTIPAAALRQHVVDGLHLDPAGREIMIGDRKVQLTNLELRLLHILMVRERQVLSGEELVAWIWGLEGGDKGMLKNLVYRLRRKIEYAPDTPRYLHTVSGKGYLFERQDQDMDGQGATAGQDQA